jgi:hypothetical protein
MGGRRRARGAYQSPGPCERSELDMGWSMHMGHGVALTHEFPQVRMLSDYRDPIWVSILQSCVPYSTFIYGLMALYTFVLNCLGAQRDPLR